MPRTRRPANPEAGPLVEYARKRDFGRTSEPAPGASAPGRGPLSFVIQKHAATRLHYDFRLELDGVLKSWSVPKGPSHDPLEKRLAVQVEDHPLDYGGFEGIIPRGEYGAGPVIVWDRGTYAPETEDGEPVGDRARAEEVVRKGLAGGKLSIQIAGGKLRGSWALVKMQRTQKEWLLIKHRDAHAREGSNEAVLEQDRSVLSGVTIEELRAGRTAPKGPAGLQGAAKAAFPTRIEPMLATMATGPFSSPNWVFEPKLDGIRAIAFIRGGKARLVTRRGNDVTGQYPVLATELSSVPQAELVLDGEIVAFDERGRPSFQELQQRMNLTRPQDIRRAEEQVPVYYYLFDLLYEDGYSLMGVPLTQRHNRLALSLPVSDWTRIVDQFEEDGETAYEAAVAHGLEGLIAKRADSRYERGSRSHAWLKIKATDRDDFILCGYTAGQGNRERSFGSLLMGFYDEAGQLRFAGNVGTGFDEARLADLKAQLDALRGGERPFEEQPDVRGPIIWVRPELVAEIKFAEWTKEGRLRAPVFMGLRPDKPADDVRRAPAVSVEEVEAGGRAVGAFRRRGVHARASGRARSGSPVERGSPALEASRGVLRQLENPRPEFALECEGHRIPLTNLEKEMWPAFEGRPAITKRALLRYLARVAPYMLPHLAGRPLTLVRYPNGIHGEKFYQRHWEHQLPKFARSVRIYSDHNVGDTEHMVCDNLSTLLWLGQVADLELHTWYSRIEQEPDGHHLSMQTAGSLEIVDASIANYPDFLVFDLDPYIYSGKEAKGAEPELNKTAFLKTCDVALWLKQLLDELQLNAFVKTTGKTGLHVFVPILRHWDYDETRAICQVIGQMLLRAHPREITMDWSVNKRTGKVFFDHNQNVRSKTLASIFSPRAAAEGGVSMPLRWEQVGEVYPTDFTIHTVPDLLQENGDPWAGILAAKTELRLDEVAGAETE